MSPRFVAKVVALNLLAPFYVAQAANAVMQRQAEGGVIINIGSVAALTPAPGTAAYAAAKGGLTVLTRALALEFGPRVRVNQVTAGLVRTETADEYYGGAEDQRAVAALIPAGRMAVPDDIADACLLLASPLAGYVSGAELRVDGGGEVPGRVAVVRPRAAGPSVLSVLSVLSAVRVPALGVAEGLPHLSLLYFACPLLIELVDATVLPTLYLRRMFMLAPFPRRA